MKHFFVSHELATQLGAKGFREMCLAYYPNTVDGVFLTENFNKSNRDGYIQDRNRNIQKGISAPLYQQVVDWFKEEHDIWISKIAYNDEVTPKRWTYHVNQQYCNTQSMEGAIEEAIKLINSDGKAV